MKLFMLRGKTTPGKVPFNPKNLILRVVQMKMPRVFTAHPINGSENPHANEKKNCLPRHFYRSRI